MVSTHSRPKAAGLLIMDTIMDKFSFNSQPPEGGWLMRWCRLVKCRLFQLTAARRRLACAFQHGQSSGLVSTHSRPKAAGFAVRYAFILMDVSTHSRPKAAGSVALSYCHALALFQLTAARRRLVGLPMSLSIMFDVSTHSRPKAAGRRIPQRNRSHPRFNSQPPEGGWQNTLLQSSATCGFNSQPPEGGWGRQ